MLEIRIQGINAFELIKTWIYLEIMSSVYTRYITMVQIGNVYTWYIQSLVYTRILYCSNWMIQPVPKAYRKWWVKFRKTPSIRTGFPAVIQHSLSVNLHVSKIKNLKRSNFGQSVFFRPKIPPQNALCGKTGCVIIELLVCTLDGMVLSSSPTF